MLLLTLTRVGLPCVWQSLCSGVGYIRAAEGGGRTVASQSAVSCVYPKRASLRTVPNEQNISDERASWPGLLRAALLVAEAFANCSSPLPSSSFLRVWLCKSSILKSTLVSVLPSSYTFKAVLKIESLPLQKGVLELSLVHCQTNAVLCSSPPAFPPSFHFCFWLPGTSLFLGL